MGANNKRLDDGYQTVITLANLPTVKMYEKEVTPPGYDSGGPIDTTTMRNVEYRTFSPKALKTLTPMTATVAYATDVYDDVRDQIGVKQAITVTFPDDSSLTFFGYIDKFAAGAHSEGAQPTATLTIQPTNLDPDTGEESPPVYDASGSSGVQS